MSKVEISKIGKAEHDELCCTYASLILNDWDNLIFVFCFFMNLSFRNKN